MPASSRILAMATPAAPAPEMTARSSPSARPVSLRGVAQRGQRDDGRAVLVVVEDRDVQPLLELALDLEAAGRRDVLQVHPAEGRARAGRRSRRSRPRRCVASAIGTASTPPNCLKRIALPSITGRDASGPMSPSPSTAVPSVTTATTWRLPGVVVDQLGLLGDGACTPRRRRACTRGTGRPCPGPARWPARPSCRRGAARTPDRRARGARRRRPGPYSLSLRGLTISAATVFDPFSLHGLRVATPG